MIAKGEATGRGIDIVFSDYGIYWRTVRKTAHKALQMYGSNRENLERVIQSHSSQLVKRLEGKRGASFDPARDFSKFLFGMFEICHSKKQVG